LTWRVVRAFSLTRAALKVDGLRRGSWRGDRAPRECLNRPPCSGERLGEVRATLGRLFEQPEAREGPALGVAKCRRLGFGLARTRSGGPPRTTPRDKPPGLLRKLRAWTREPIEPTAGVRIPAAYLSDSRQKRRLEFRMHAKKGSPKGILAIPVSAILFGRARNEKAAGSAGPRGAAGGSIESSFRRFAYAEAWSAQRGRR
jgi:hypothetical protein